MNIQRAQISIIIPVLNEEANVAAAIPFLRKNSSTSNIKEIIIVDGGSTDATVEIASELGAIVVEAPKGRSKQLNYGAKKATGEVLYFVHVDTLPPKGFDTSILNSTQAGSKAGCFRMKFDSSSRFLAFFAWFTKLNFKICRGGDQTLFINKALFEKTGGFNESYVIYEDNEFTARLYDLIDFKILSNHVITSARRFEERGEMTLQYHFGVIHLKNLFGTGPEKLHEYYTRYIS